MSRVLRNCTGMVVTFPNTCTQTITTVREVSVNDATAFQPVGSDNMAAPKKYVRYLDCRGTLTVSDPLLGATAVSNKNNCNLAFQALDIDNFANVNVLVQGVAFGQPGVPERYGEIIDIPMPFEGGQVTIVSA